MKMRSVLRSLILCSLADPLIPSVLASLQHDDDSATQEAWQDQRRQLHRAIPTVEYPNLAASRSKIVWKSNIRFSGLRPCFLRVSAFPHDNDSLIGTILQWMLFFGKNTLNVMLEHTSAELFQI